MRGGPGIFAFWIIYIAEVAELVDSPRPFLQQKPSSPGDVAELVDALASGASGSDIMGVRLSPSPLCKTKIN